MQWFGHGVRLPECSFVNIACKHDFDGKRPKRRPPKCWPDQMRSDTGLPLLTAERRCQDRREWRKCVIECCKALWSLHLSQVSQLIGLWLNNIYLRSVLRTQSGHGNWSLSG